MTLFGGLPFDEFMILVVAVAVIVVAAIVFVAPKGGGANGGAVWATVALLAVLIGAVWLAVMFGADR